MVCSNNEASHFDLCSGSIPHSDIDQAFCYVYHACHFFTFKTLILLTRKR